MHRLLPILTSVTGIVLLTYMIVVEDEPGALPLALILTGGAWYLIATRFGGTGIAPKDE